jgi:hypothetical protein
VGGLKTCTHSDSCTAAKKVAIRSHHRRAPASSVGAFTPAAARLNAAASRAGFGRDDRVGCTIERADVPSTSLVYSLASRLRCAHQTAVADDICRENGCEATRCHSGIPTIRNASAYRLVISLDRRRRYRLLKTVERRWVGSICLATAQACRASSTRPAIARQAIRV